MEENLKIPNHVAIILDGNGRPLGQGKRNAPQLRSCAGGQNGRSDL